MYELEDVRVLATRVWTGEYSINHHKTPIASLALNLDRIQNCCSKPRTQNSDQGLRRGQQKQRGKEGKERFMSLLLACSSTAVPGRPKQKQMYVTFHHSHAQNVG